MSLHELTPGRARAPVDILRIAHRGAQAQELYGEDDLRTLAAQGASMVEFDVSLGRQGELVARHGGIAAVAAVMQSRWKVWRRSPVAPAPLPVEAVLTNSAAAGLLLYADLKELTHSAAERLVESIHAVGVSDRIVLASAKTELLHICADVVPNIPRSVLFRSTSIDPVALAQSVGATFVHPCWERKREPHSLLERGWIERVRSAGLGTITWHEEREFVLRELCTLGVDGICTDEPVLLTTVVSRMK